MFLTTLVMAAMLLVACGAEETSTTVPGMTPSLEVPPTTADTTATSDGALLTETAVPGTDLTTTPEIPVTGEEDPSRLTNQLDFTVWNQDGEQVGEVNDMVIDLDETRISYVIVGTGGFLEIGEKDVLLPWDLLEIGTGDTANAFILQIDQETFNNAPDVDLNTVLPQAGEPVADWDVDIRGYWDTGIIPNTPAAEATVDPNMTPTTDPGQATATPEMPQGEQQGLALEGVVLASDLLGASVNLSPGQGQATAQGQDQATATPDASQGSGQGVGNFSGNIVDLIVDVDTGEILFVVVNTTLDDGDHWIPIPLRFFQWAADYSGLLLNVNPAQLQEAPFFQADGFPNTTVDGWNSEFNAFWDTITPP
ncbi:MAG TPA: PRC-barrel domain-containing protein [Anaerolineales bacterium]|nr:PRC-barrel domain-containing protein [Anaerolineales bacterium]